MKRKILLILLSTIILVAITYPVFAAKCGDVETTLIECNNTGAGAIRSVLLDIIDILSIGVGIVAVIGIAIFGIQYLTAGGNTTQTTKAKRRLYEIVIGIFVYALMWTGAQWLLPGGLFAQGHEVTSVSLRGSKTSLNVGDTQTLSAILDPIDADNESFTWKSSNSQVATIDDNGKIVAKSEGTTTISVTTSNGTTAETTINVVKPTVKPSQPDRQNDGPDTEDRHKLGSALAVAHDDGGSNTRIRYAIQKKYYAIECDTQYTNGVIKCAHDGDHLSGALNFLDVVDMAKANGVKVLLDLKIESNAAFSYLASQIKSKHLENWIIIQRATLDEMRKLNSLVGTKLEYWGLVMTYSNVSKYVDNASEYKSLGMTAVNVARSFNGFSASQNNTNQFKSAGFDVCIFTWVKFSDSEISKYNDYGAKYLMTNRPDLQ